MSSGTSRSGQILTVVSMHGGPTGKMNQTLYGITKSCNERNVVVLGAHLGVEGILKNDYRQLNLYTHSRLIEIRKNPGAYLGTSKFHVDEEVAAEVVMAFKKKDVHYWFPIGGDSTLYIANLVAEMAKSYNYDLIVAHVPKTIDCDIILNDHTCGAPSAGLVQALIAYGLDQENRSTKGLVFMSSQGRDNEYLPLCGSLLIRDLQPLIYTPAINFTMEYFIKDCEDIYSTAGRGLVIIAEGIRRYHYYPDGSPVIDNNGKHTYTYIAEDAARDFGSGIIEREKNLGGAATSRSTGILLQYLASQVKRVMNGVEIRLVDPSYILRSFPSGSPIDSVEAQYVGAMAVYYAIDRKLGSGSVVIRRSGEGHSYSMYTEYVNIGEIAGKTKEPDRSRVNNYGNRATEKFRDWAGPLLGPVQGFQLDHLLPSGHDPTSILPKDSPVKVDYDLDGSEDFI